MATFSHLPSGKWRAQVRRAGLYRNATFAKKRDAEAWAAGIETQAHQIAASGFAPIPQGATLEMLIDKYVDTFAKTPGKELLPLLRAELLKRIGGEVTFQPLQVVQERKDVLGLQKTFDLIGSKTMKWYSQPLELSKAVCRIERRVGNIAHGTGFVVRGGDFHKKLGDEPLVLTNHHVISDTHELALPAGVTQASFMAFSKPRRYAFDPQIVWTDPDVDATLVRFADEEPKVAPFPPGETCPTRTQDQPPPIPCVYIIHYPFGGDLSISFQNNELVAVGNYRLHYRAATETGSSGSPVFDDDWNLVGLHRRGKDEMESLFVKGEKYKANEAFWIGAVRDACRKGTVKTKRKR